MMELAKLTAIGEAKRDAFAALAELEDAQLRYAVTGPNVGMAGSDEREEGKARMRAAAALLELAAGRLRKITETSWPHTEGGTTRLAELGLNAGNARKF